MAAAAAAYQRLRAGLTPRMTDGRRWRLFDCKGEVLGRLASRIAVVLMGKDKPTYTPYLEEGDVCIVINARHITFCGNKLHTKVYKWHTGYPGHLKEVKLKEMMRTDPTKPIRKAVFRMLPRNKLHGIRMKKLRVFADGEHPFGDKEIVPFVMPPRNIRVKKPRVHPAVRKSQKKAAKAAASEARAATESAAAAADAAAGKASI